VPHFSNSIPRSPPAPPPRSPPPAPPQGARHIRRLRLYPAQLLPAVAVAASSSGASPPPPPLPCIRLGFADLLAAGGVGVMGCAADEEGEAGASGTTPAPNHQWDCNPLSKPVRVPFFGTTTTHGAHATLSTSELKPYEGTSPDRFVYTPKRGGEPTPLCPGYSGCSPAFGVSWRWYVAESAAGWPEIIVKLDSEDAEDAEHTIVWSAERAVSDKKHTLDTLVNGTLR